MKIASVAALSVVAAADVPVFSSNDDYDAINLNIRLLAAHNASNVNATFEVTGSVDSTYNTPDSASVLCTAVKAPTESALSSSTNAATSAITNCDATASRRALSASDVAITQAYKLGFTSADAAATATSTINGAGFAAAFQSALNTALTN